MDWRDIPSLSALRAFESTARLGTFSAAARELNVTPAGIAQHVRGLEDHFGEKLVYRDGQSMALTEQGRVLAEALSEGFGMIASGVRSVGLHRSQRPLNISTTPGFAEVWLMPRLGAFWEEHPDIWIQVLPSMERANLRLEGVDMALRFGDGNWRGVDCVPLLLSPFVVVCAPSYTPANTLDDMENLETERWLFSQYSREQYQWGERIGLDFHSLGYREMASNALALSAVRSGHGLTIQSKVLVDEDIASGRMKVLHEADSEGLGYYIITLPGVLPPNVKALRNWLITPCLR